MSDTIQGVSWSLERPCPFRGGKGWERPDVSREQLSRMRSCAAAMAEGRVIERVCVTSYFHGTAASGWRVDIPSTGFRVADAFAGRGRPEEVAATCGGCEANVSHDGTGTAGCFGFLYLPPDSDDLDRALWRRVEQRRMRGALERGFEVTTPLWYGLWMKSPLRRPQCEVLWELLSDLPESCVPTHRQSALAAFTAALRAALDWELPLHVSMAPPGHVDLGWDTEFAHCPRCKAEADVPRWTKDLPSEPYTCRVCGNVYDPSKTRSSVPEDLEPREELERQLGPGYDPFVYAYARAHGHTDQQIAEALDRLRQGPEKRKVAAARREVTALASRHAAPPVPAEQWGRFPEVLALELGGGVVLELRLVPAGEFLMGSTENPEEQPVHAVRIDRPLYVGTYPVTEGQWAAVTGSPPEEHHFDRTQRTLFGPKGPGGEPPPPPAFEPRRPADGQNWLQAQAFCAKLSQRVGRHLRLLSEAEWEYACRAGTSTACAFGDVLTPEQAYFREGTEADDLLVTDLLSSARRPPVPAGRFPPNAWGLFDMHGNVAEWCEDAWHDNYDGAPADGSAWADAEDQTIDRVVRGGSANARAHHCRSAARWRRRGVYDGHGLRVACVPRAEDLP